ncbi:hypothetical protein [Plantactinospora sp. DSM 117369]
MTSPAAAFLDQLASGSWVEDPDLSGLPDDAQIGDCDKLLAWCQLLADDGLPPYTHAVNYLQDGIWEFKIGAKRLSFYDTPGDGSYIPKAKIKDRDEAVNDDEFWWFPDLDPEVRLGYAFPKLGPKALPDDIATSFKVREEDLSHDV